MKLNQFVLNNSFDWPESNHHQRRSCWDEEPNRRPYVAKVLQSNSIDSCISIEGFNALHMIDGKPTYSVAFKDSNDTYDVKLNNGEVLEDQLSGVKKIKI